MIALDEILYKAIVADSELMQTVGGRVKDVRFEVGDDGRDNVPLPYIVIIDAGSQEQPETKDVEWDPTDEHVQAAIEVSAKSPGEVRELIRKCRKAVARYVLAMDEQDQPDLTGMSRDGVDRDDWKPCYFDVLRYQCTLVDYNVENDTDDEQDED